MTEYDITNIVGWPSQPEMDKYLAVARFAGKEKEQRIAELEAQNAAWKAAYENYCDAVSEEKIDGIPREYAIEFEKIVYHDAGVKLLAELEALRRIAKAAGAWRTADGVLVYGERVVFKVRDEDRQIIDNTAASLCGWPQYRKQYYSTRSAALKAAEGKR